MELRAKKWIVSRMASTRVGRASLLRAAGDPVVDAAEALHNMMAVYDAANAPKIRKSTIKLAAKLTLLSRGHLPHGTLARVQEPAAVALFRIISLLQKATAESGMADSALEGNIADLAARDIATALRAVEVVMLPMLEPLVTSKTVAATHDLFAAYSSRGFLVYVLTAPGAARDRVAFLSAVERALVGRHLGITVPVHANLSMRCGVPGCTRPAASSASQLSITPIAQAAAEAAPDAAAVTAHNSETCDGSAPRMPLCPQHETARRTSGAPSSYAEWIAMPGSRLCFRRWLHRIASSSEVAERPRAAPGARVRTACLGDATSSRIVQPPSETYSAPAAHHLSGSSGERCSVCGSEPCRCRTTASHSAERAVISDFNPDVVDGGRVCAVEPVTDAVNTARCLPSSLLLQALSPQEARAALNALDAATAFADFSSIVSRETRAARAVALFVRYIDDAPSTRVPALSAERRIGEGWLPPAALAATVESIFGEGVTPRGAFLAVMAAIDARLASIWSAPAFRHSYEYAQWLDNNGYAVAAPPVT